jgi:hydrogenase-4 component B
LIAAIILAAIGLASASGVPGLFFTRSSAAGERIAAGMLCVAAGLALFAIGQVVLTGSPAELSLPWRIPGAALSVRVDGLAAFFLVPIFLVPALGAIFGLEYWPQASHPENGRRLRLAYGLLVGGLSTTVVAANGILFLYGWEVMALAAFVAIGTEDHLPATRAASYLYLVATRVGTFCLFAMFALVFRETGSFALLPMEGIAPGPATAIFVLALLGFGLKAGMMPLHIWLPSAHAAAPSHVSALMSGVLIKIGIYGLVRTVSLLPSPPVWWGLLVMALGAISGVLGVAFAIGQHDLKRLLAYHSIENIGIILLGVGVAVLGRAVHRPELVVLGLAGGLFHVWNHALFKSLLFLSAGAVIHACHTRDIDSLGGLLPKMPRTSTLFLIGAVAICGLPPLNGFVSELLVYLGLFAAARAREATVWLAPSLAAAALALIGGLALACFVKVFGAAFLGHPRSNSVAPAHDGGALLVAPMSVLAACCAVIGLAPGMVAGFLDGTVAAFARGAASPSVGTLAPFPSLSLASALLMAVAWAAGALLIRRLQSGPLAAGPTWDCGYAAPANRMQYSSSSFAQMLVELFGWALRPRVHRERAAGPFAKATRFSSHVDDAVLDLLLRPSMASAGHWLARLRWLQPGSLHLYLLYVVVALVLGLVWAKGIHPQ